MRFLFYFRLSSYLLVASGFLALLITDEYGLISALLFALLMTFGWFIDTGKLTFHVPRIILNSLTLLWLAFCVIDVLYLRHIMAIGLVNFLVFLQASKLLAPKTDRDYVIIALLSFFELLISSIMTFSVLFAFVCLAFVVTGSWALITLHLKQEIQTHLFDKQVSDLPSGTSSGMFNLPVLNSLVTLKFFSGTFGITVVTCLLSFVVFLILPRAQEGVFFSYGSERFSQKVSGFSEEVVLDSFGLIRQDHTPVMQIELPGVSEPSEQVDRLYWRGISYNFYDGRRWRSDAFQKQPIHRTFQNSRPRFWLVQHEDTEALTRQNIKLLSNQLRVVFGASRLHAVEGYFYRLNYDRFNENVEARLPSGSLEYVAFSDLNRPDESALRTDSQHYPEEIRQAYLQLPELPERIEDLAASLRGGKTNPYDIAIAVLDYLQQNYQYSLQVQRSSGILPLEDFLFVNKAGHCEYYATSMAILLRLSGIPTRLVNGFAQGRWNEFGRFFTVRQSNAHAWVEVFFPSYGWVLFDPTPASAFSEDFQQFTEQSGALARFLRYSEFLRTRWNRYVIDYSLWQQANLAVDSFYALRSTHAKFRRVAARVKASARQHVEAFSWLHAGGLLAVILVAGGCVVLWLRFAPGRFSWLPPEWRFFAARRRDGPVRFYRKMLSILARKGVVKTQSATPGEFMSYIHESFPVYEKEVEELTHLYYGVRYGKCRLDDDGVHRVETLLTRLRKHPKALPREA